MGIVSGCNKVNNKIPVFIDLLEVWIFKSIYPGLAAIEQEVILALKVKFPSAFSLLSNTRYFILFSWSLDGFSASGSVNRMGLTF